MKNYINRTIILALCVLCIILFHRSCESEKNYERVSNALTISDLTNQKFENEINEQGEKISFQKQLILSKQEALENNLLEIIELKKYKKIKSKTKIETLTKIDTVFVSYSDYASDSILKPKSKIFYKYFNYTEKDNWYSLSGNVTEDGINMYDMQIKNKYNILIADKKLGLFRRSIPQIVLTNENPYTSTISMQNVQIQYDIPFYKKQWFWFILGSASTIYLTK
jgi:hypothetical protein